MTRVTLAAALVAFAASAHAATPAPGDFAFTAFNADEDGFAIVALKPVAPFTVVYFTDNEWSGGPAGTGAFNAGEAVYGWTNGPVSVPAGTLIRFHAIDQAARGASLGVFGAYENGANGLSATGDTLYAYAGASRFEPTALLAAVSSDQFAGSDLAGSGLVRGVHAVAITTGADFGEYTGPRAGLASFGAYAPLVNDAARWTAHANGSFAATIPDLAGFSVSPVPEPQTWLLMATSLGLLGFGMSGRRARTVATRSPGV